MPRHSLKNGLDLLYQPPLHAPPIQHLRLHTQDLDQPNIQPKQLKRGLLINHFCLAEPPLSECACVRGELVGVDGEGEVVHGRDGVSASLGIALEDVEGPVVGLALFAAVPGFLAAAAARGCGLVSAEIADARVAWGRHRGSVSVLEIYSGDEFTGHAQASIAY